MGGELECSGRRTQVHPVETVLDRTFENRSLQVVVREVGVEKQPVVPPLVPLASLPALPNALVEAGSGQRVRNRVAHIIEGEAAREVDALDERVGGLAQVADHEEAGGLDPGRDARLHPRARLVRSDAFLHLLQHVLVACLDAEEDPLAPRAPHLPYPRLSTGRALKRSPKTDLWQKSQRKGRPRVDMKGVVASFQCLRQYAMYSALGTSPR